MKAFVMKATRVPFTAQDVPDPQPGPGQVRMRLHASGVCGTDVHVWNGELPVPLPIVLGHEPAGVIRSVQCARTPASCNVAKNVRVRPGPKNINLGAKLSYGPRWSCPSF